jgi:hypothetical protein
MASIPDASGHPIFLPGFDTHRVAYSDHQITINLAEETGELGPRHLMRTFQ